MPRRSLIAAAFAALALGGCSIGDDDGRPPQLGTPSSDKDAAAKLGFPASATKNTIRVGGGDAAADAAGVASAVFPATNDASRPTAVVLVDSGDWQGAVAAGVMSGAPIGAPMLLSVDGDLPPITTDTLKQLNPKGSDLSKDAQVIRIGSKPDKPSGYKTAIIEGKDAYERAAAIDRFFSAARGRASRDVVVASGEQAEFAVPAAAWAARSGDAVLLTKKDAIPAATEKALKAHGKPNIYVLGPKSVISAKVEKDLAKLGKANRIEGPTAVENAIAFARYHRANFGWGVVVPGYNFSLAGTSRPLDAAPAAVLGTRGVFAPMLLTDNAKTLPKALEAYLLSVQPGYEDDPGQAVFNRVWILGDDKQVSVAEQGRIDQITELVPVQPNAP